ncbi:MAG: hypothetical protein IJ987_01310 [Firmicutes bacterium]|nr:hypothetical protein [Bacillota bacterium]
MKKTFIIILVAILCAGLIGCSEPEAELQKLVIYLDFEKNPDEEMLTQFAAPLFDTAPDFSSPLRIKSIIPESDTRWVCTCEIEEERLGAEVIYCKAPAFRKRIEIAPFAANLEKGVVCDENGNEWFEITEIEESDFGPRVHFSMIDNARVPLDFKYYIDSKEVVAATATLYGKEPVDCTGGTVDFTTIADGSVREMQITCVMERYTADIITFSCEGKVMETVE